MKRWGFDVFLWFITVLFTGCIFMMPDTVPIHWDYNWNIDGYGSRYYFFILSIVPVLIYYGMLLTKNIDPLRKSIEKREKTYHIFRYGLTIFSILFVLIIYYLSFNSQAEPKKMIFILMAVVFIGMGNYMPKVPKNYFLGIKTPWTLANEYVWQKTHKIGGYSWIIIGIVVGMYGLFNLPYEYIVMIGLIGGDTLFLMGYSYCVYRRINTKNID